MASALEGPMRRLLQEGKITKEDVKKRVASGKLTKTSYKNITGEKYDG